MGIKPDWGDVAQYIRDSVTMEDVLSFYAPETPRRNHRCPCPIHNGKDYNFSYMDHGYKCFSCGASGDTISFVMAMCGLERRSDAMLRMNKDLGLGLQLDGTLSASQSATLALKREEAEKRKAAEERWWDEYHLLYDEWIRLDKIRRTGDPDSEEYADAVKKIDKISYMIDELPKDQMLVEKDPEPPPEPMFSERNISKDGNPKNVIANFLAVMRSDERYAGIRYNEMSSRAEIHTISDGSLSIEPWTDADEAKSMNYLEEDFHLYSRDKHSAALRIFFNSRRYNPLKDIVDSINWDGQNRCEFFLRDWAKTEDSAYTREVSRLIFAGGIHRLYAPGTKFDDVPILIGTEQGEGKSSLVRFLAINDQYYGEVTAVEGQPAIEQLQGKWICEISEMLALTKQKEQEAVKAYITRTIDSYRKPWDKNVTEFPRRCVFIGTSNRNDLLTDKTGNRRYYPIEVHSNGYEIFKHEQEIRDYICQCWAEARERYRKGDMPNFANQALVKLYREAQENAMQDDWRVGAIKSFLEKKNPGELTCVREVCHRALSSNPDFPRDPSLAESKDIGMILTKLPDWERVKQPKYCGVYGKQRCWQKKEGANKDE